MFSVDLHTTLSQLYFVRTLVLVPFGRDPEGNCHVTRDGLDRLVVVELAVRADRVRPITRCLAAFYRPDVDRNRVLAVGSPPPRRDPLRFGIGKAETESLFQSTENDLGRGAETGFRFVVRPIDLDDRFEWIRLPPRIRERRSHSSGVSSASSPARSRSAAFSRSPSLVSTLSSVRSPRQPAVTTADCSRAPEKCAAREIWCHKMPLWRDDNTFWEGGAADYTLVRDTQLGSESGPPVTLDGRRCVPAERELIRRGEGSRDGLTRVHTRGSPRCGSTRSGRDRRRSPRRRPSTGRSGRAARPWNAR